MRKRKLWACDFKKCEEMAQWYRRLRGKPLKLCTKHYAQFARKHWGRSLKASELIEDDIRYLKWKEYKKEEAKYEPFEVSLFPEDGATKIRIRDRQTGEKRSFVLEDTYFEKLLDTCRDLRKEVAKSIAKSHKKPSIDEYVKRLRNGVFSKNK